MDEITAILKSLNEKVDKSTYSKDINSIKLALVDTDSVSGVKLAMNQLEQNIKTYVNNVCGISNNNKDNDYITKDNFISLMKRVKEELASKVTIEQYNKAIKDIADEIETKADIVDIQKPEPVNVDKITNDIMDIIKPLIDSKVSIQSYNKALIDISEVVDTKVDYNVYNSNIKTITERFDALMNNSTTETKYDDTELKKELKNKVNIKSYNQAIIDIANVIDEMQNTINNLQQTVENLKVELSSKK